MDFAQCFKLCIMRSPLRQECARGRQNAQRAGRDGHADAMAQPGNPQTPHQMFLAAIVTSIPDVYEMNSQEQGTGHTNRDETAQTAQDTCFSLWQHKLRAFAADVLRTRWLPPRKPNSTCICRLVRHKCRKLEWSATSSERKAAP